MAAWVGVIWNKTAVERARALLTARAKEPDLLTVTLNPNGGDHGVQCCGGEVTLLLEPVYPRKPHVAIFGAGHVGLGAGGGAEHAARDGSFD